MADEPHWHWDQRLQLYRRRRPATHKEDIYGRDVIESMDCGEMEKAHARIEAEVKELRAWAQQVHDALDGKQLPPEPDEAPARIKELREEKARLVQDAAKAGQLYDDAAESYEQHITDLQVRLTASQAREQALREALREEVQGG